MGVDVDYFVLIDEQWYVDYGVGFQGCWFVVVI